jgi:hypothetical protein
MSLNFKDELLGFKFNAGILQRIECSEVECKTFCQLRKNGEPLPEGVYAYISDLNDEELNTFYRIKENKITDDELKQYFIIKHLNNIKIIKNCLIIITVILLLLTLIVFFGIY